MTTLRAPGFVLALALLAPSALAQGQPPPGGGMPGMPNREQIREQLRQVFASSPSETIELAGICKITYKKVPTDPQKIAEMLGKDMKGGGQLPPGVGQGDVDNYMRQYEGEIATLLNEFMADLGEFEALVPLKSKSKVIPVGKYKLGIEFEGERPAAIVISDGAESKLPRSRPVPIRLQTRSVDLQRELVMELKEPKEQKAGKEEFNLQLSFLRFQARSKSKVERAPAAAEAGGDDEPSGSE